VNERVACTGHSAGRVVVPATQTARNTVRRTLNDTPSHRATECHLSYEITVLPATRLK